jgi:hypothetical protein
MLWQWLEPNDAFQDLPIWRALVIATAMSLRRHHAGTLIVPMSLIRDAYQVEIFGGLTDAGEEVLHVYLEADPNVLRERLKGRVPPADSPGTSEPALDRAVRRVDAASSPQPISRTGRSCCVRTAWRRPSAPTKCSPRLACAG